MDLQNFDIFVDSENEVQQEVQNHPQVIERVQRYVKGSQAEEVSEVLKRVIKSKDSVFQIFRVFGNS